MQRCKNLGPGLLVAAAFIGPGTVTTASIAGAKYGFALLWAVIFSTVATIVLQEMAGRLGVVTRQGLGEALRQTKNPMLRLLPIILVIVAISLGNAAFETGNITGASLGLEVATGLPPQLWAIVIGVTTFLLLASGTYQLIERVLIGTVIVMSVVFVLTAIVARPNMGELLAGMLIPRLPAGSLLNVIALIGTTVVPYNLFLHASSVQKKWLETVPTQQAVDESRFDTVVSISVGGLITLAIAVTAAAAFAEKGTTFYSAAMMAQQLEPLLGAAARDFFAIGLFAGGLSSAITAPLATAYATTGVLGWQPNLKSNRFRTIWILVLVTGTVLAVAGKRPVEAIVFAQAANGLLLPIVAVFLLLVMNRTDLLQDFRNRTMANVLGIGVVLITASLGIFQLLKAVRVLPL